MKKCVVDAWNRYHHISLHPDHTHDATFLRELEKAFQTSELNIVEETCSCDSRKLGRKTSSLMLHLGILLVTLLLLHGQDERQGC